MDYSWHDVVGNLGVALIVGCYLAVQTDRLDARSRLHAALNAGGAALVLVSLYVEFNLSAAIIEGFWLVISLVGLIRRPPAASAGAGGPT